MNTSPKAVSPDAVYKRIENLLRLKISQGHWPVGTMLPGRRDLAKEYGVSQLTVDRAVANLLAEGTLRADSRRGTFVAQVVSANEALALPQTPIAQTAATIGIIAPLYPSEDSHLKLSNRWVRQIIHAMESALLEEGKSTLFYNTASQDEYVIPVGEAISILQTKAVDAIAILSFNMDLRALEQSLAVIDTQETPLVCMTAGDLHLPIPHVGYNNYSGGYQAAQHLLRIGHRRILFLAPFTASWAKERMEGARRAVEHAGLPAEAFCFYQRAHVWSHEEDPTLQGYEFAQEVLQEDLVRGAGVICASDGVAYGLIQAASERGLAAGNDFALIGFDDNPSSGPQGLTSLRPPMEEIGREAARLLLRLLRGDHMSAQSRLHWHLIKRASTRTRHTAETFVTAPAVASAIQPP